jgi:hypothetical protein
MKRSDLAHIIRAASEISGDKEIVVIGTQAIHAQNRPAPKTAMISEDADVYPLNHPELADDIDANIGELSPFHQTHGYYGHGVSPKTAILPEGWQARLVDFSNEETGGAIAKCLDVHDLVLSKYAANREKDHTFNREVIRHGFVNQKQLLKLLESLPVDEAFRSRIRSSIIGDFKSAYPENNSGFKP